jgi:stearoyl-CoA desaturase (delta-9 desaturase)
MHSTVFSGVRPWEQPFWKPAPGQAGTFAFLVLIHVLAVAGLILFPLPGLTVLVLSLLLASLGGLGTTVGYHRSHHGGFWWAHLRWLYQSAPADHRKWCPDLDRRRYRFWTRAQLPVVLLSLLCGLPFGWEGFFWMGAIRIAYSLHIQCLTNSLLHLERSPSGDSSKNLWWLGPFQLTAWGENWHRNHHSAAGSARIGWHWWQVDVGWYFIRAMETVGLASGVKRVPLR